MIFFWTVESTLGSLGVRIMSAPATRIAIGRATFKMRRNRATGDFFSE